MLLLVAGIIVLAVGMTVAPLWGADATMEENGRIPFPEPDTHKGNWVKYHGSFVDLNMNEAGQRGTACYACHERNDCIECHNTRAPQDHTNFWRTRSHGMAAGANRERCLKCHRQDYCVRCHNETAPRTHIGNWRDRHCGWCHFGSAMAPDNNCNICHRVALHTSAPHGVTPGLNCITCHS